MSMSHVSDEGIVPVASLPVYLKPWQSDVTLISGVSFDLTRFAHLFRQGIRSLNTSLAFCK